MTGQTVILGNREQRLLAKRLVDAAPIGAILNIRKATRSLDQNAKFHAICSDLARSKLEWAGSRRTADEWKVLLVSGHTKATDGEVDVVPGIEGEFVNIRESTARMSIARAASLLEYTIAFCASHGIETETQESERSTSTVSDDGAERTDEPPLSDLSSPDSGGSIDPYVDARRHSMDVEPEQGKF